MTSPFFRGLTFLPADITTIARMSQKNKYAHKSVVLTSKLYAYLKESVKMGKVNIVFFVKTEQRTGFGPTVSLVTGIIGIFAGVLLLFRPGIGSWTLIMLFPLWFIAHCISRLTHLPMIRYTAGTGYYYFSLVINIIGLIMGFIMFINPMVSLFSVGYLIGGYLILSGIDHIVLAVYELRA